MYTFIISVPDEYSTTYRSWSIDDAYVIHSAWNAPVETEMFDTPEQAWADVMTSIASWLEPPYDSSRYVLSHVVDQETVDDSH